MVALSPFGIHYCMITIKAKFLPSSPRLRNSPIPKIGHFREKIISHRWTQMDTDKKRHSKAVRGLMQGCIVTSRFSDILENREGRLSSREGVIGLLNARLVHPEKLCQEPVLCCSCPLNPVGQATSRIKGSRRQCACV